MNSQLFTASGPAAFPVLRDFKTDSTSLGVKVIGSMTAWGTGIVPRRKHYYRPTITVIVGR